MVENKEFIGFFKALKPVFQPMSRDTIRNEILGIYEVEKKKTMELLKNNMSRVAVTTETWSTVNKRRQYMTVAANFHRHFMDFAEANYKVCSMLPSLKMNPCRLVYLTYIYAVKIVHHPLCLIVLFYMF